MSPADIARLRAVWPAIVRAKGGRWPQEPIGCIFLGSRVYRDGRLSQPRNDSDRIEYVDFATPNRDDVPDLTLPGTRAAVLAWLGLPTFQRRATDSDGGTVLSWDQPAEHTATTALAAVERWHEERCR